MRLPNRLAPLVVDGRPLVKVELDITAYLNQVELADLDFVLGWFERLSAPEPSRFYAISELSVWSALARPRLTIQGRAAAARGEPRPWLATIRARIAAGRPFRFSLWNGDLLQTRFLSFQRVRTEDDGVLRTFVRSTVPVTVDTARLHAAAVELCDTLAIRSGHAGLSFGYDSDRKYDAFTALYPLARRYWGIDVEALTETLAHTDASIKGISWLTLLGSHYVESAPLFDVFELARTTPEVRVSRHRRAVLVQAGAKPTPGDIHLSGPDLDPLFAVGTSLDPLIIEDGVTFSGDGFIDNDNTMGWFHRFADPSGWR